MLRVGIARADITPHAGIELAGFGKRLQPSLGVNDPIHATALVVADERTTLAVVDCELVAAGAQFVADVRRRAAALASIPADHIMVCCTHTHYGPRLTAPVTEVGPGGLTPEQAYREHLVFQLAGLIYEAQADLQPARLRMGWGESDIGVNRRERTADGRIVLGVNPGGPVDRAVGVCRVETAAGKPLAAVVNFAAHPVGQDVQIRKVSADYVGCVRRVVEELTGATCLFWQGATGNINCLSAETDYANAQTLGTRLGREAVRVWEAAEPLPAGPVRVLARTVELPPYRCLSAEHAESQRVQAAADLEAARKNPKSTPGLIQWMEYDVQRLEKLKASWTDPAKLPPAVKAQLQAAAIGEWAWAGVPGELFNEIGSEIKRRSPFGHTFVVAYANDWIGYLPTPKSFAEGGYEVSQVCNVSPEGITMLADQSTALLAALREG